MTKFPILSIIVPVYNGQNYLTECLESIVSNDISQVEILLINDGSTDDSIKIIKKFSKKYSQITYYDRKNNGVSSSRNFGLRKSKGKWIWFIDCDDLIQKGSLKRIINFLTSTNLDIFIFQYIEFENSKEIIFSNLDYNSKKIDQYNAMKTLIDSRYATFPWNKIFKKSLFSNIYFPIDRNFTEDMAIMYKIYEKASSIFITSNCFYFYRQRNNSLVHTISREKLKASALSHYEMATFFEQKYPKLLPKLKQETVISIISYFHRLSLYEIRENVNLYKYIINIGNFSELSLRSKVEILSLKYCYPFFKFIGYIGTAKRKLKK